MDQYTLTRECKVCKNIDSYKLDKFESAFFFGSDHYSDIKCSQCSASEVSHMHIPFVEIDSEIMTMWSTDESLSFLDQDEEIFLAETKNIDLIFTFIDSQLILPSKRATLIESLMIVIYNMLVGIKDMDIDLLYKVKQFLLSRIDLVRKADNLIMDYVKEVVYPELNLKLEDEN